MLSAVLVAAAATCAASGANELVDVWESRDTSKGGIGSTVEFRADGVAIRSLTVIVNMAYRVSGDRLDTAESKDQLKGDWTTFTVDADTFTETLGTEAPVVKRRFGGERKDSRSIVGAWTYQHYTGAVAYERYTPDGRMEFRLTLSADTDCYAVSNGHVTFNTPKPGAHSYAVKGDELTIERDRGGTMAYVRVKPGPWYPREAPDPAAVKRASGGGRQKDER